jgi:hypothetical protein
MVFQTSAPEHASETSRPRCSIVSEVPLERTKTSERPRPNWPKHSEIFARRSGRSFPCLLTALSTTKKGGTHSLGRQLNP